MCITITSYCTLCSFSCIYNELCHEREFLDEASLVLHLVQVDVRGEEEDLDGPGCVVCRVFFSS